MSTLVAQTISNGTVSTSTANVVNGAKAWVNFNGTGTVAIRASYNVSSITDNGTGTYTVNFTNAFSDANYAALVTGGDSSGASAIAYGPNSTPTTTAFTVSVLNTAGSFVDRTQICVGIFR
jgi:hypothetical protein